jgi:peptidylprolyl isomerase
MEIDLNNILYLELKDGTVAIQMLPQYAPKHVSRIKELVRSGFYDGAPFHRVIAGFVAQSGDPINKNGTGGSGVNIEAEFNQISHTRGICSMARSSDVNSASSQFFICLADSTFLDRQYSVWGVVISGMTAVDKIKKGDPQSGAVVDPDIIISMKMADQVLAELKPVAP